MLEAPNFDTFIVPTSYVVQMMIFLLKMLAYSSENQPKLFCNFLILTQYSTNFQI